MPAIAMRLTEEFFGLVEQFTGTSVGDIFDDTPYLVMSAITETEFNMKLMTEDEMLEAYKDNSELHIISF